MMKMRIEYVDASLEDVLDFYAKGFEPRGRGESVYNYEPFVDTAKGRVIFRLTIKDEA